MTRKLGFARDQHALFLFRVFRLFDNDIGLDAFGRNGLTACNNAPW
jgi:hypothetical protein